MVSTPALVKAFQIVALAVVAAFAAPLAATDFDDMVAAERAFAADASARNTRDAFLAAYDEDGIGFAPGPVNAHKLWQSRSVNQNRLEWTPEVAEIAASGDLGYISGPWRFTEAGAEKPNAFGHFFSIWRKGADGKWKVLVDHGVTHAETPFPEKVTRRGGVGSGAPPTWPVGLAELRQADLAPVGALDPRLVSADFLRLREGMVPDGRAVGSAFPSSGKRVDSGLVIAGSGELAMTWGGGFGVPGWIRVWRRPAADDAPGRGWVLVVDMSVPPVEPDS